MPPSTSSGEPKSITHGSMPASCRMPTAPSSRVTSHIFADIIIGWTMRTGGPAGFFDPACCPAGSNAAACTSACLRRSGTVTAPHRSPDRLSATPRNRFWAVAIRRSTGLVTADKFRSTALPPCPTSLLHKAPPTASTSCTRPIRVRSLWDLTSSLLPVAHLLGAEALHLEYPTQVVFESVTVGVNDAPASGSSVATATANPA